MVNMIIVFKWSFQFPVFLRLFSLKYAFTRLFNVLKNFKLSFVENVGEVVFILIFEILLKCTYYNFFKADIPHFLSTKTVFLSKILIMEEIIKQFPNLTENQQQQFQKLESLYHDWNTKINVISRKDIDELYTKHVLHSLAIAKVQSFEPGTSILDVGTGGGFPGIPLAILFPESYFYLIDVIAKKIKVVQAVAEALGLKNVKAEQMRAENVKEDFDFIVSRAVTNMPDFYAWVKDKIKKQQKHELKNGILYLKGGDLTDELALFPKATEYAISNFFSDEFFETKKVVHLPLKYKP